MSKLAGKGSHRADATQRQATVPPLSESEDRQPPLGFSDDAIERGRRLPLRFGRFDCGPSQIERSCAVLNRPLPDPFGFTGNCPLVAGSPILVEEIARKRIAAPIAKRLPPIGPPPRALTRYANAYFSRHNMHLRATPHRFADFRAVVAWIDAALVDKTPPIVLVAWGPFSWHYVTVVKHDAAARTFTFIETNMTCEKIGHDKLQGLMYFGWYKFLGVCLGWFVGVNGLGWAARYNGIDIAPVLQDVV